MSEHPLLTGYHHQVVSETYMLIRCTSSEGMAHLFTMIDRLTRWPEAIPLPDSKAKTCAQALIRHWILGFGFPEDIMTD